ncbi:MAG: LysR family transcriptional regulator [Comamonadaceae bacterium]|nr:MAG: LysR family transcriptional regulator [Comamonadaceae bacterium]
MRDLDLTSLRLFVAVCEQRSIARAGEQSNIVGSAISKRLAQLEDAVGTPLLVRRRRGVEPTAAGETLLEHARAMLASSALIERDMAGFASGLKGQVRVLATASVMAESLADDVAAFLKNPAHHDIQVDIEERLSAGVVRGVREGSASLGLCWDVADLGGLQTRPWRSDTLAIVVHPTHPLAGRKSLRFEETLDYPHVSLPVASAVQLMLQRAAALVGKAVIYRVIVSNFESAMRVVRANLGLSVVPEEVATPYARTWDLRVIPLAEPWARRRFALCFRDESALSPAALLLLAQLEQGGASEADAHGPAAPQRKAARRPVRLP